MATVDDRISALKEKLKQEQAKKASIEARRRAAEAKKSRSEATRKKVLIGALIQSRVARGKFSSSELETMLNEDLTRADDRALFGLPPIMATEEPKATKLMK